MKTKGIVQLFAAAALCSGQALAQDLDFSSLPSIKDISAMASQLEVPAAKARKAQPKEWTIMVFMNGKNNLADYTAKDMNEMEQLGSSAKINIVVEVGKTAYTPPSDYDDWDYPDVNPWGGVYPGWNPHPPPLMSQSKIDDPSVAWTGVRRYYVQKDNDVNKLGSLLIEELPKTDMGDWNKLAEFALWAKAKYPAKKYMLIVWNHGDGWKTKLTKSVMVRGISNDDETGHSISTVELGQALAKMGGVDIYASDACLMQMMEVVYELKNYAPVIVGSEETEPGDGWDYTAFLSRVTSGSLTPEAMAKAAVEGYSSSYSAKRKSVTLSALRTRNMGELRNLLDQWVTLAMSQEKTALMAALNEATNFEGADSRDLLHFLNLAGTRLPALQPKGAEIAALVSGMMIKNSPVGIPYKNAGGLAAYMPTYSFSPKYSNLALSKEGKWDEFMQWMTAK